MRFALALHPDGAGGYGVIVPDLPGCFAAGATLDQAIEQARHAVLAHAAALVTLGAPPPAPQPLAAHHADPDLAEALWVLLEVPVERAGVADVSAATRGATCSPRATRRIVG